jgi:hypothetical protein
MTLSRVVAPETLDLLSEDDERAMRSRRDLRRVHAAMGTRPILRRTLRRLALARDRAVPLRVLELGAGDGTLMLGLARSMAHEWPAVELTLLDRQRLVVPSTLDGYAALGWMATPCTVDVLDWAAMPETALGPVTSRAHAPWDLIIANLFIHHFAGAALDTVLAAVAAQASRFVACEPRRSWLALAGSHLVLAIGANAVTREDAVLSVHAGFRDQELSQRWPAPVGWRLEERGAGLFSHCFTATRLTSSGEVRLRQVPS